MRGGGELERFIQDLLAVRREIIDEHPDDPRRPTWLADQAADCLQLLLPIDSSWLACRFGVPDDAQQARALRAMAAMSAAAMEAELEVDRAVRDLGTGGDAERRRILETERQRRVPFLRGVAACLEADLGDMSASARAERYRLAVQRLAPLAPSLPGAARVQANLYTGLALAGLREWDEAAALLGMVAGQADAGPRESLAAKLALAEVAAARDGPVAARRQLEAIGRECTGDFCLLLVADRTFRMLHDTGRIADAWQVYTNLAARRGLGAHVFARLQRLVEDAPGDDAPGLVAAAHATMLTRAEHTRADGAARLEALLAGDRLDVTARGEAMLALSVARLDAGDAEHAARTLIELAERYPTHDRAEAAIDLAVSIASEHHRRSNGTPEARGLLRTALEVLLSKYPNRAGRWHYTAGCLALDEQRYRDAVKYFEQIATFAPDGDDAQRLRVEAYLALARQNDTWTQLLDVLDAMLPRHQSEPGARAARAEALLALGRPREALDALEGVSGAGTIMLLRIDALEALGREDEVADVVRGLDAQSAAALLAARLAERVAAARPAQREGALDATRRSALVSLAAALLERLEVHDNPRARLVAAEALRMGERFERALSQYDQAQVTLGEPLEIVLGRAECLYALARDAEAMELYKRLSVATDRAGGDVWWLAQLRMLQVLDRTGRNTHRIRPHVQRLRERDPELGGERYRRELERLAMKNRRRDEG